MNAPNLYFWINITVFLFISRLLCAAQKLSHISPCLYPVYRETQACGVQDFSLLDGFFCDPDSTVSMSEVQLIEENLRRIYRSHQDKCVCPDSVSQQCWYKFGFAFKRELTPIEGGVTDLHSNDHCPFNASLSRSSPFKPMTPESILNYGQNFARLVRERWKMAECGEDFLVLVIQRRSQSLSRPGIKLRPFIILSYGSLVNEKITALEAFHSNTFSSDSLHSIVESENNRLQDGYPLNRVLISLIGHIVNILKEADELPRHSSPKIKHHVPGWAWITFGVCGVLCVLMSIGLYTIRSTRRGSQRGKPGIMAANSRPWKAGFGEDQPTQNYNVNLVQMLFPHPKTQANV